MAHEFCTAGLGKAVEGRLPNDNIAFKMEDGNTLRLESEKSKHPEFWCKVNIGQLIGKKRKRDRENGNVCIVTAMAESEYDGVFTGDVDTQIGMIPESELSEKFKIDLTETCTTATATGTYAALVQNISNYKHNGKPFDKLLVLQIHNEGEPDSDYEKECKSIF